MCQTAFSGSALGCWSQQPICAAKPSRPGSIPHRLIFAAIDTRERHLARLALADLALDTYHHGGGVTTIDALVAGVPTLSAAGDTPSSRMGATLLSAVGLPELIVDDLASYERCAVDLANNRDKLGALKSEARGVSRNLAAVQRATLHPPHRAQLRGDLAAPPSWQSAGQYRYSPQLMDGIPVSVASLPQ